MSCGSGGVNRKSAPGELFRLQCYDKLSDSRDCTKEEIASKRERERRTEPIDIIDIIGLASISLVA